MIETGFKNWHIYYNQLFHLRQAPGCLAIKNNAVARSIHLIVVQSDFGCYNGSGQLQEIMVRKLDQYVNILVARLKSVTKSTFTSRTFFRVPSGSWKTWIFKFLSVHFQK